MLGTIREDLLDRDTRQHYPAQLPETEHIFSEPRPQVGFQEADDRVSNLQLRKMRYRSRRQVHDQPQVHRLPNLDRIGAPVSRYTGTLGLKAGDQEK